MRVWPMRPIEGNRGVGTIRVRRSCLHLGFAVVAAVAVVGCQALGGARATSVGTTGQTSKRAGRSDSGEPFQSRASDAGSIPHPTPQTPSGSASGPSGSLSSSARSQGASAPSPSQSSSGFSSCGGWSAPSGSVGDWFGARYGEIHFCGRYGTQWVIATTGTPTTTGVLAVYKCANGDTACLNGASPHPVCGM